MTVLEQYQKAFKNSKTQIEKSGNTIKLHVWTPSLLSETMVRDTLKFNLDGSEILADEVNINFF